MGHKMLFPLFSPALLSSSMFQGNLFILGNQLQA